MFLLGKALKKTRNIVCHTEFLKNYDISTLSLRNHDGGAKDFDCRLFEAFVSKTQTIFHQFFFTSRLVHVYKNSFETP